MKSDDNLYGNWLSSSKSAIETAFGTTEPKIITFPHCIFPAGEVSLRTVAEVVGGPIGIWGNCIPLIDASGEGYAPPWDNPITSANDFKLWKLPYNQQHAMGYGGRLPGFIAALAADTSESLLSRMYEADCGEDQFDYDTCIKLLADWIEEMGWAYVPLEHEAAFALFVGAGKSSSLVPQVRAKLAARGIQPVFEVAHINGQKVWTGPLYPDHEVENRG